LSGHTGPHGSYPDEAITGFRRSEGPPLFVSNCPAAMQGPENRPGEGRYNLIAYASRVHAFGSSRDPPLLSRVTEIDRRYRAAYFPQPFE
jgi:hypothetical protein